MHIGLHALRSLANSREREREGERGAINQQKDKQSKEGSDGMSAEPAVE